jgi:hypothetical protein
LRKQQKLLEENQKLRQLEGREQLLNELHKKEQQMKVGLKEMDSKCHDRL